MSVKNKQNLTKVNFKREPYGYVLCITGFVFLNSDKAVMTTLEHKLSLSMSPDHVPANKAH